MSGPWEDYQGQEQGPWADYAASAPQSGGTRLYSPNPNAPTNYGGGYTASTDAINPYRVVGQLAQGNNDAWASTLGYLPDLVNTGLKAAGLPMSNTPALGPQSWRNIFDYTATLPGRARDALSSGSLTPFTEDRTARFQPENRAERVAYAIGSALGTTASTVIPAGAIANVTRFGSVPNIVAEGMRANPVQQLAYNTAGNVATEETGNPYIGAAVNIGLPLSVGAFQRAVSAAPARTTQEAERRALLEYGRQEGLGPLTAGKITDSRGLQTLESAASNIPLPVIGGRVARTEEEARNAYQMRALEKTGTYGETAATPSVLDATKARIGRAFDSLEGNTTVNIDPQFGRDIANAKADFSKQLIDQMPASISKKLDELETAATTLGQPGVPGVTLDGTTYKNIRSKLSAMLPRASGTDKQAVGAMIDALDGAVERSLPPSQVADWQTARQQWRNYLAIDKAVGGSNNPGTAVGNIPVAAFARASRDNPDLERLAQYGSMFIGDKVANTSKTASHNVANHLLGGGAVAGAGAIEAYHNGLVSPTTAAAAGIAAGVPYAFELGMNNPVTRALLLARYRNPTPSFVSPSLVGNSILNALRGLR